MNFKKKVTYIILLISLLPIILIPKESNNNKINFNNAITSYSNKKIETALENFLELSKTGYDNFEINYNIGCCYYKLQQPGKARFYFERALFFKPFDSDLFHNLTMTYHKILKWLYQNISLLINCQHFVKNN